MLGGPWEETAERGRALALRIIPVHLSTGHDVVVPQLVANPDQLRRFEKACEGYDFVVVLLDGESRLGAEQWQANVSSGEMRWYADNLDRLSKERPGIRRLPVVRDDESLNLAALQEILQAG